MQCRYCGAEVPAHFSFCNQCGQPLREPLPGPAPKPGGTKILWVVLGLGILFLILVALGGTGYWVYKTWKAKQQEEYSQKEGAGEEAEEEPARGTPRRSSGSKRLSDAQYYEARRQWEQAMAEYRQVLQEDPDSYEAHYGLGNCYRKKLDYPQAINEYKEAIRLNPRYIPSRLYLARLYARQKDFDAAIEQLEAAQRVAPKDPQVERDLASYRKRRAARPG